MGSMPSFTTPLPALFFVCACALTRDPAMLLSARLERLCVCNYGATAVYDAKRRDAVLLSVDCSSAL